jgi:hypothetical protein
MSQTNVQSPIQGRNEDAHEAYVQRNRDVAFGAERTTAPGPVQMGSDPCLKGEVAQGQYAEAGNGPMPRKHWRASGRK